MSALVSELVNTNFPVPVCVLEFIYVIKIVVILQANQFSTICLRATINVSAQHYKLWQSNMWW